MLKDLNVVTTEVVNPILKILAELNGSDTDRTHKHLTTGIYLHDGYPFNFNLFMLDCCDNKVVNEWVENGVCDNYEQIIERFGEGLLSNPNKNYAIGMTTVRKSNQEPHGGWRWHKWGEYIGTHEIQHEYLYHEKDIETVYCYRIFEIE